MVRLGILMGVKHGIGSQVLGWSGCGGQAVCSDCKASRLQRVRGCSGRLWKDWERGSLRGV